MSFGHQFWLGGLSTQGQRVWTAFRKIFSGTPHLTIFVVSKYAPQIPYLAVFGHVIEGDGGSEKAQVGKGYRSIMQTIPYLLRFDFFWKGTEAVCHIQVKGGHGQNFES